MNQAATGYPGSTTVVPVVWAGLRPVPTYRLEERDLRTGEVEVLARGQRDRDAVLAVFQELVRVEARRPEGRYRTTDPAFRLVVVSDGSWSQQTKPEVSPRANFAAPTATATSPIPSSPFLEEYP